MLYPSAPALSPIGLGGATFGREIDESAAFVLMDRAYARGVTLFDTAASYSAGGSERIVGAWLASRRPAPSVLIVATKISPPYTPAVVEAAIAESAERLGAASIDVLYLHKWDPSVESPETLILLNRLVSAGHVKALGVSNFSLAQLSMVLALQARLNLAPLRLLQNNNNLAVSEADEPLTDFCKAHNISLVTYSPLGAGFLTGKHQSGVQPGTRFDLVPRHQEIYFTPTARRRLERLSAVSVRTGQAMADLALAWALHRPGVASVLIGCRTPAHIDQGFAALAFNEPAIFAELEGN